MAASFRTIIPLGRRFLLSLTVWLVLTAGRPDGWVFGVAAAALATEASRRLLPLNRPIRLAPILAAAPWFLWRSLLGGVDVAWRALHPRLPLRPGWIVHRTGLPPGGPRVLLGAETSLLPGTLAAGVRGDRVYVHCLNTDASVERALLEEERPILAALRARGERP